MEPSFAGIHQVLREIWLFEHIFQARNFLPTSYFGGYRICQQIVHKITKFHPHLQLKSKRKGKTSHFSKKLIQKSQNNYQRTKINQQLLVSIDFIIKSL